MVLNEEVRSVELVYAGQNVDVTETATSFYNERQRVEIDLIKSLAIDEPTALARMEKSLMLTFWLVCGGGTHKPQMERPSCGRSD